MPRFYFHVALRGDLFEDRDGGNYFDAGPARMHARRLALDLHRTGNFSSAVVLTVDEFGQEVARFPVDNVVELFDVRHAVGARSRTRRPDPDRLRLDVPSRGK
jgi:hypothetical protein